MIRLYGVESVTNGGRYLGRSSTCLRQQVWYYLVVGKTKTKTKKYGKTKTKLKLKNKSKRKSHWFTVGVWSLIGSGKGCYSPCTVWESWSIGSWNFLTLNFEVCAFWPFLFVEHHAMYRVHYISCKIGDIRPRGRNFLTGFSQIPQALLEVGGFFSPSKLLATSPLTNSNFFVLLLPCFDFAYIFHFT